MEHPLYRQPVEGLSGHIIAEQVVHDLYIYASLPVTAEGHDFVLRQPLALFGGREAGELMSVVAVQSFA